MRIALAAALAALVAGCTLDVPVDREPRRDAGALDAGDSDGGRADAAPPPDAAPSADAAAIGD